MRLMIHHTPQEAHSLAQAEMQKFEFLHVYSLFYFTFY